MEEYTQHEVGLNYDRADRESVATLLYFFKGVFMPRNTSEH